eukprot:380833-Hanusia_phi.AAC.1
MGGPSGMRYRSFTPGNTGVGTGITPTRPYPDIGGKRYGGGTTGGADGIQRGVVMGWVIWGIGPVITMKWSKGTRT